MIEDFSWIMPPHKKGHRKSRNSSQKRSMKCRLAKKYGWTCKLCGKRINIETSTLDHIIRVREGGSWNIGNLRLSCKVCNEDRA